MCLAAYLEISEGHKLDDVPRSDIPSGRSQQFIVTVEELHGTEVRRTHTHNDDGHRQTGGFYNSGARLVHVCDHAICDDEQHKVLLRMQRRKKSQIYKTCFILYYLPVPELLADVSH